MEPVEQATERLVNQYRVMRQLLGADGKQWELGLKACSSHDDAAYWLGYFRGVEQANLDQGVPAEPVWLMQKCLVIHDDGNVTSTWKKVNY